VYGTGGGMMEKGEKREKASETPLRLPSSSDLRGRQSVRATFKLSERAIEAISIVATHLGIKQKSLFDHLIEDMRSLHSIARGIERDRFRRLNRIQKTYVLSRKTLSSLDEASKKYNAPRDALVEYSINRLMPVIEEEREKHQRRREILEEITEHVRQGEIILEKARKALGEDDQVFRKLDSAMDVCRSVQKGIENFVERCSVIEDF
jgi:hypothetical protein